MTQSTRVALTISAAKARASKHGRVRAIVLVGVHLIVAIHIAHWMMAKRTLAPMELNESMYTLEQGAITVGGILMALILLASSCSVVFFALGDVMFLPYKMAQRGCLNVSAFARVQFARDSPRSLQLPRHFRCSSGHRSSGGKSVVNGSDFE
jgi:hypothetical protein